MNHKASIYVNPLIQPNLYYAKLLDLHVDTSDQPYIWASLVTGPANGEHSNVVLSSIIYCTPKSEGLIEKFRRTFRITGRTEESYAEAIGRWGCVSIFPKKYQAQTFSCVGYIQQNALMVRTAGLLEEAGDIVASDLEVIPGLSREG